MFWIQCESSLYNFFLQIINVQQYNLKNKNKLKGFNFDES